MKDLKLGSHIRIPIRSASYVGLVVLCTLVLTFGAVFYIWQRYQYVRLGFEVNELRREKAQIEAVLEPLEVEAAYLSRPQRIEALARDQGLRPPAPEHVIVVDPDGPAPE